MAACRHRQPAARSGHPRPSLTAAPRLYSQDRVQRDVDRRDDDDRAARAREAVGHVRRLDVRLLELEREQVHGRHGHAASGRAATHHGVVGLGKQCLLSRRLAAAGREAGTGGKPANF